MTFRRSIWWFTLTIFVARSSSIVTVLAATETPEKALYYGFFFDEITANSITSVANLYLNFTLAGIPRFKVFLESAANNASVADIQKYYTKPLDPNTEKFDPYYHVTAKYCGNTNCSTYESSVSESIGKAFEMQLVGFYFTNRTYGIRVKLTEEQLKLYDNNSKGMDRSSYSVADSESEGTDLDLPIRTGKETFPGLSFVHQDPNLNPTINNPHITIGCAPNISAVVTGTDLLKIIEYERNINETLVYYYNISTIDNRHDFVIQYGEFSDSDAFVIYPESMILANATFKPYYQPNSTSSNGTKFNLMYINIVSILIIFKIF